MTARDEGEGAVAAATPARLQAVRERMRGEGLDAWLVRGTDEYLNEYVPAAESLRIWLTGFTGSVGDALVLAEEAFVFVDGRYYLQAERETDPRSIQVVRVPFGVTIDEAVERKLVEVARKRGPGLAIGYEAEKLAVDLLAKLSRALAAAGASLRAPRENLAADARGAAPLRPGVTLEAIPDELTGESRVAKLGRLRGELAQRSLDGILLARLDEVAWITNLRGYEIEYSSTFRGMVWVGRDEALLFVAPGSVTGELEAELRPSFRVAAESSFADELERTLRAPGRPGRLRVLIDPAGTTAAVRSRLSRVLGEGGELVEETSPVQAMKAKKNPRELSAMVESFRRADQVVAQATAWLNGKVGKGRPVNEAEFAAQVEALFREAGARSLSFRVIAAAGSNGAVIHYSHPDPTRRIRKGELMLLDTGAYFEPGYATDLTRTFLAGGAAATATPKQKLIYTLVLKASIRGLKARFPEGTTGVQLDAIVRSPIWDAGYDYLHGTGHGVGVLVHEFPPRISTRASSALEPGQVFSIEPGIYLPDWGGVRIENLATVVADPKAPGFLQVKPLTFSPLDRRLIDSRRLTLDEKQWLRQYLRGKGSPGGTSHGRASKQPGW